MFNQDGDFQAVARITGDAEAARGVVAAPGGYWRKLTGGANTVNDLTRAAFADMGNAPSFSDTRVEVAPVSVFP